MTYLVLARKWRPQTFDEIVGQSHVTRTLQNAVRTRRVAHAFLFTGVRGVGKTTAARILAKALNCQQGPTSDPCLECSNCMEIARGGAVDVLEIDAASNRGIDNIRELRETVRYRPAKSRYKVYIIDEVHMLTADAFNALLKTLEEPPEHVVFVLATTEPHKIPATILSRCQRFDFRRVQTPEAFSHLKRICEAESVNVSEVVLYAVAREADGSMRDAQSLLEQLLAFSGEGLADEELLDILGVVDRRSVYRVGRAVLDGDVGVCMEVVQDLYRRGIDSKRFCQQLCDYFRNLLFTTLGKGSGGPWQALPEEEMEVLKEHAEAASPESLHLCFQLVMKGEEDIRRSSLPRTTLEMLLLRLTRLPRLESLQSVMEKLETVQRDMPQMPPVQPPGTSEAKPRTTSRSGAEERLPGPAPASREARTTSPPPAAPPAGRGASAEPPQSGSPHPAEEVPPPPVDEVPPPIEEVPPPLDEAPPSPEGPAPGWTGMETGGAASANRTPEAAGPAGDTGSSGISGRTGESAASAAEVFPPQTPAEPAPGSEPSAPPEEAARRWPEFLDWLKDRNPVLASKLKQSRLQCGSGEPAELQVLEMFRDSLERRDAFEALNEAAREFFGRVYAWKVACLRPVRNETAKERSKAPGMNHTRLVLNHPSVQKALQILEGDLQEVRPAPTGRASSSGDPAARAEE